MHMSFAEVLLVALVTSVVVIIGTLILQRKFQDAHARRTEERLRSFSGKWIATGDNGDMFDGDTGTHYTDVPMVRVLRVDGVDHICWADVLHIPNIDHCPARGEIMLVRLRAPSDPQPPHWQDLGCHLFASSCGYFLTDEGKPKAPPKR